MAETLEAAARATPEAELFDAGAVDTALSAGEAPVAVFRRALQRGDAVLDARFESGVPASELIPQRADLIDRIVTRAWRLCLGEQAEAAALVAVGGYGRGELHPGSDVDLMVLVEEGDQERLAEPVEALITLLWDLGLEIGHSVRSPQECIRQAEADVTIATNLMESRLITGAEALFRAMRAATGPDRLWPSRSFFEAKRAEQEARHARYEDTGYNLEPNIKGSPGGLRDIQMVGWVARRHFGVEGLHDLVALGFLTEAEYQALAAGQRFLWDVRYALHRLAGRREDRLLLDHQLTLARRFGYEDTEQALAVEQFMQRYFRTVMELSRLNEMLLQLFQEAIVHDASHEPPVLINKRFQARRGYLEVTHRHVFRRYPWALLEAFLVLQQHPELKGVRASTIRLIREYRNLIDETFRSDLRARSLFMEIVRQPSGLTHVLRRMHRYGVLGRYIPAFGRITGRMQYDLFHVYTIDTHTLFVIRNLRRFALNRHAAEHPQCNSIMARLPKPELLYLAGLFHDIAKGRGADHSELGAREAYDFCLHHDLPAYDARLVAWLVRHHLAMSMTAQRKDLSDPSVITEFARLVGDQVHLDYLYLLTVADIRATNPAIWNSWKDALLAELYVLTKRALRRGLANPIDKAELIRETQANARRRLQLSGLHHMTVRAVWRRLPDDYFLRHNAEEIAWHTEAIARTGDAALPLILVKGRGHRGGTELFVYARDHDRLFAHTVSTLDRLGLSVQEARIITTDEGVSLDSYLVLDGRGRPVTDRARLDQMVAALREAVRPEAPAQPPRYRPLPRRLRHFHTATEVAFSDDPHNSRTALELITADRPGLLARVGEAFSRCGVRLESAKIATVGERADDVFFITDSAGHPLAEPADFQCLRTELGRLLDDGGGTGQPA